MNNLLYKIDKKSLLFASLGDFPIDRFLRQFNVEIVAIWEQTFHQGLQYNDILYVLKNELPSLQFQLLFHSLLSKLQCFSPCKIFQKFPHTLFLYQTKVFQGCFFEKSFFRKLVKCLWNTLFSLFEL